jgi:hypothetical protein
VLKSLKQNEKEIDIQIANERKKPFYVINEYAQVFAGLRRGYPHFSDKVEEAKPIHNDEQFRNIRRGHLYKIERIEPKDLL